MQQRSFFQTIAALSFVGLTALPSLTGAAPQVGIPHLQGGDFGIPGAIQERVVAIPCGRYSYGEILRESGSADAWIRYRAAERGCVTIAGGQLPQGIHHVILDGVVIDAVLDTAPLQRGFFVIGDNVGLEHSEIRGPKDVFTGVPSCREAVVPSRGVWLEGTNLWLDDVTLHGFQNAALLRGARIRVSRSYFHNNFNGVSMSGRGIVFSENVLWMHPNHGIIVEDNDPRVAEHAVLFQGNLVVDSQESLFLYGGAAHGFVRNTWYDSVAQPCGLGIKLLILDRSGGGNLPPQGPLLFLNNVQAADADALYFYRFEVPIEKVLRASDGNYFFRPQGTRTTWARDSLHNISYALPAWRERFSFDLHSQMTTRDPLFANPSIYPIPASYKEARARFRPRAGSPLCGAAVGGGDIGAVPCSPPAAGTTPPKDSVGNSVLAKGEQCAAFANALARAEKRFTSYAARVVVRQRERAGMARHILQSMTQWAALQRQRIAASLERSAESLLPASARLSILPWERRLPYLSAAAVGKLLDESSNRMRELLARKKALLSRAAEQALRDCASAPGQLAAARKNYFAVLREVVRQTHAEEIREWQRVRAAMRAIVSSALAPLWREGKTEGL